MWTQEADANLAEVAPDLGDQAWRAKSNARPEGRNLATNALQRSKEQGPPISLSPFPQGHPAERMSADSMQ